MDPDYDPMRDDYYNKSFNSFLTVPGRSGGVRGGGRGADPHPPGAPSGPAADGREAWQDAGVRRHARVSSTGGRIPGNILSIIVSIVDR